MSNWVYDSGGKKKYQDDKAYDEGWDRIFGKKDKEAAKKDKDIPNKDKK
jgi:hypothetical protein|tara:strand:+ start:366 stop:512 length:147 start_codon:yes stop_codon:yes gene_type:complete